MVPWVEESGQGVNPNLVCYEGCLYQSGQPRVCYSKNYPKIWVVQKFISHSGCVSIRGRLGSSTLLILCQEPRWRESLSVCSHVCSGRKMRMWSIIYQPLKFILQVTLVTSVIISLVIANHVVTSNSKGAGRNNPPMCPIGGLKIFHEQHSWLPKCPLH